jgi:putative ABC transport system permease protein
VSNDSAAKIRRGQQFEDVLTRLRAIPGVTRVGGATGIPFVPSGSNGAFLIRDRRVVTNVKPDIAEMERLFRTSGMTGYADYRMTTVGYFETMHIPLVRGRVFNEGDTRATENVAVISAALAKKTWPNESALGKYIDYSNMDGDTRTFTVVGVVGDVRERGFETEPRATFYGLFRQRPSSAGGLNIVLETSGDPASVIVAARGVVRDIRPDVPPQFRTMDSIVGQSVAARRFTLVLVGVFGGAALLLATLGVYSVVSYLVAQRARELTIRVALGARSEDIVRLVLGQGVVLAFMGIVLGAVAAFAAARLIGAMLFGIGASDPVAFVGVTVLLAAAAVLASYVPARRASRVDAMDVLRSG